MSNSSVPKNHFIMVFKIGLKSDLRMKLEEVSHLTQERKPLKMVLQKFSQALLNDALTRLPNDPMTQ